MTLSKHNNHKSITIITTTTITTATTTTTNPNSDPSKQATPPTYLDQQLRTLDVSDERDREVDGHAAGPVALGHEGGHATGPSAAHGQVDHQVELLQKAVKGRGVRIVTFRCVIKIIIVIIVVKILLLSLWLKELLLLLWFLLFLSFHFTCIYFFI